MSLYSEALTLKRLAEKALKKGDKERASQYLRRAIENLEILEQQTNDEEMKLIWKKAKNSLISMLENIDEFAEKIKAKGDLIQLRTVNNERDEFHTVKKEPKNRAKLNKKEVIEECKSDIFTSEIPSITFDDVANMEDIKRELRETIEWQIKYPEMLKKLNLKPLKGILLYGPPGTGKTYLVKAAAGEFKLPLIIADPATIMSKYVGESEKVVKKIFECAKAASPSIVFVDEVDKILPLKSSSSDAPKRVEAQFLQEMDGIKSSEGTIVVFSTNEPWNISPALIRPGRIDRIIYVGPPNRETRQQLFELYLRDMPLDKNVDIEKLLDLTEPNEKGYFSSSGIAQICNEVKKVIMRKFAEKNKIEPATMEDFVEAIKKVPRSISHKMLKQYESWGLEHTSF